MIFSWAWQPNVHPEAEPFIFGDMLPDAPALAPRGELSVGVQTIEVTNPDQLDILNRTAEGTPTYDRKLKLEVWYPAVIPAGTPELVTYDQVMGNNGDPNRPLVPFQFQGRALRNAETLKADKPYPLVIVSHGYTGSRYLFTYLTENLASKGYVVVSIDHTESTFKDAAAFTSTLLNRSLDQLFVLNEMDRLSKGDGFLAGLLDADNTGLIGYSMGGYGALNTMGAGYSEGAVEFFKKATGGSDALLQRAAGQEAYTQSYDDRIKAVVAFAPWGMSAGVWDSTGLLGLKTPTMFVAGSEDDISGYEKGIKAIFDGTTNADRYLLTYLNARHNIAPNPAPAVSLKKGIHLDEYLRYADSVWDQKRINNVNQHFVTAFL
ncbi:MAG: alpha/beta hydrolase family protein, partial [Bacteroidia bacterium]